MDKLLTKDYYLGPEFQHDSSIPSILASSAPLFLKIFFIILFLALFKNAGVDDSSTPAIFPVNYKLQNVFSAVFIKVKLRILVNS